MPNPTPVSGPVSASSITDFMSDTGIQLTEEDNAIILAVQEAMAGNGTLVSPPPPANLPPTAEQLAALQQAAMQQAVDAGMTPTPGVASPQATAPAPAPTTAIDGAVPGQVSTDAGIPGTGASTPASVPPPPDLGSQAAGGTLPPPTGAPTPAEVIAQAHQQTQIDQPVPAGQYRIPVPGVGDVDLSAEDIHYLLQQNSWMEQIPQETKIAWGQILEGRARAVSAEEYAAYDAWVKSGSPATQAPAPAAPATPDLSDLDPQQLAYVQELERRATVPAPVPAPTQDAAPSVDQIIAEQTRLVNQRIEMEQTAQAVTTEYMEQFGMTPEQAARLRQVAGELRVVPSLTAKHTVYSPTGQVIRPADFRTVLTEAYGIAMSADEQLRKVYEDYVYNQRVAQEAEANRAVNEKKGFASSLATAPSAAVPSGQTDLKPAANGQMDLQATSTAIANSLREMIAAGTAGG